VLEINQSTETAKASSLADTEVQKICRLFWMIIIGELNCLFYIRDTVLDVSQFAETLEASEVADREFG
jgi:hypothetical protein